MSASPWLIPVVLIILFAAGSVPAAGVEYSRDPTTGLESWQWQGDGASFTFSQLLPDQTRAYFQGRGFKQEDAERLALACLFQTIIRNRADAAISVEVDLSQWRVTDAEQGPRPPRLEVDWQQEWERRQLIQPARIAFRWSMFPTRQIFQPGDWNMGMVTFGPLPDSRFDLELTWEEAGMLRQLNFDGMRCAPDRH